MATETALGVGIRRDFVSFGPQNFEDQTTVIAHRTPVQYAANYPNLYFNGTNYNIGDALPFDSNGNSTYSVGAVELLRLYWNSGWIVPLSGV